MRINPPSHTIFTDASLSGWGSHVEPEGLLFHGVWTETQSQLHINILKMMAISMALKEALHTIKNSTVLVSTDNTTVVAYLRSSKCRTSHDSVSQHRLVIPPANFVCRGYTVFTLSVRASVRVSVRPSVTLCFLNILKSHCLIFIKPCKHLHICKTNFLDKKVRARGQFYQSYFPL